MKKHLITLLFLIPILAIAQSNYKPGYVINLNGDTTRGYINYREWGQNPKNIDFKADPDAKAQRMGLADINGFAITGFEVYQKYIVKASMDIAELQHASTTGADTTTKTDTVFLRVLQAGKTITLYAYNDDIKSRFYYSNKQSSIPQELIYKVYIDATNGNTVVTKNTFRGQLIYEATNANLGNLSGEIQSANYNSSDLSSIAAKLNGAMISKSHGTLRPFIGIGIGLSTLKYIGSIDLANNATSSASISPKIAMGFDGFINPNVGKLIIRIELALGINSYNITSYSSPGNSPAYATTQQVKQLTATITPQLMYNLYNTNTLKVFIDAGIDFNLSAYPTNNYTTTYNNNFATVNKKDFPLLESSWLGVPIKAGIILNKNIEIFGGYTVQSAVTNYEYFSGYETNYRVGVNLLFGKKHPG
jgi:hypothetical protein